jgi:catechol 2,3-dioxygenase-like lactoylglutathione lyase family enzyme
MKRRPGWRRALAARSSACQLQRIKSFWPEVDMAIQIHHVNIRTKELQRSIAFYTEALGLTKGYRPDFGFNGAWLYDGTKPAVHLNETAEEAGNVDNAMDHVAFAVDRLDDVLSRLDRLGVGYSRPKAIPGSDIRQCFAKDPNGVTIELQGP